ncbi:MAG: protein-methionine-sulfoxide reductase catalytic subunit MsrP [Leptolinea sp.]
MKKSWNDPSIKSSDITPEEIYKRRREFLKLGAVALGGATLAACGVNQQAKLTELPAGNLKATTLVVKNSTDEMGGALTSFEDVTHYNNFYEFSLSKENVANVATQFKAQPWQLEVGGFVRNPKTFGLEDINNKFPREERVYRMRCVEGWSMVIPWLGFPLANILKEVEPTSDAKYVRFVSVLRPDEMPGQRDTSYPWPYEEGLRLDEAMNDLTILSTGLYGTELPNQNGAPIRLVVPWKYGFKSIKSIVKIELISEQPQTLWSMVGPNEYGFYSNVNPNKPHPRWDQDTERRIGESKRRKTEMFNGYEKQVASLYAGMDLIENY